MDDTKVKREPFTTYPFFKGPSLADFVFVVVEVLLSGFGDFVTHVLDLRHSLH